MHQLKQRLGAGDALLGTFVKTPHYHITEVLSKTPLDVLCLDAEHAPFDRAALDTCVLSCRAEQMPVVIRVPNDAPETLLNALDIGATGVVVPHVKSAEQLTDIVKHCYYGAGGRGYAGSTRAAAYTTQALPTNLALNRSETTVIAQIEDLEALENIDAIASVPGCDCLFVGRMDLTVALGETDAKADAVVKAVEKIVERAKAHGATTGMFIGDLSELSFWREKGVSLFLLSSDHGFMLAGAKALRQTFDQSQ